MRFSLHRIHWNRTLYVSTQKNKANRNKNLEKKERTLRKELFSCILTSNFFAKEITLKSTLFYKFEKKNANLIKREIVHGRKQKQNNKTNKKNHSQLQISRRVTHLSVFTPSEPTFKQVWRLNEPRPSKVLAHWAPRIVLPSLHAIENGCCDLTNLNTNNLFFIFIGKVNEKK